MLSEFLTGEVLDHALRNRKAIVLRYAEGAENFAHRDGLSATSDANCSIKAFPYQGTVMVSKPGVDFTGGEFYSACFRLKNSMKSSRPRYRPTMLGKNEKWLSLGRRRQGNQSTSKAELIMSDRKRCLLPSCISASAYLHILSIKIADARRALRARSVVRWC